MKNLPKEWCIRKDLDNPNYMKVIDWINENPKVVNCQFKLRGISQRYYGVNSSNKGGWSCNPFGDELTIDEVMNCINTPQEITTFKFC